MPTGSTSTSDTGPEPTASARSAPEAPNPLTRRVSIRRKEVGLIAQALDAPTEVTLLDGRTLTARVGDIRVSRGEHVVDLVTTRQFAERYEVVVHGGLHLTAADCARLEETAGLGSTQSAGELVKAVEKLCAIKVGDIRIPFTPGQVQELQYRAKKRGRTIEQEMQAVVDRIRDELFYKGG